MEIVARIVERHPQSSRADQELAPLVRELLGCEAACVICADACLSEPDVTALAHCVALNTDCADVCATTARLVSRIGHQQSALVRAQLDACREACGQCAAECEAHRLDHCRICAESCRACEEACSRAMERMVATV